MTETANVTDATRREFWRKALIAKIAHESAVATAKTKNAEYRNVLKDAKKAGVNSKAISEALKERFQDEDVLVLDLRELLKMLDIGGVIPGVVDKILNRIDIEEPTNNERHAMDLDRAYDAGVFAGREGHKRDTNEHPAGSEAHVKWDAGWLSGQMAIASEMERPKRGRPRKVERTVVEETIPEVVV